MDIALPHKYYDMGIFNPIIGPDSWSVRGLYSYSTTPYVIKFQFTIFWTLHQESEFSFQLHSKKPIFGLKKY